MTEQEQTNVHKMSNTNAEFIKPQICRRVYSLYLNGMSVEDIMFYFWQKNKNLPEDEINGIIDFYNKLHI